MTGKKVYPSQERYWKEHPTISFRCKSREEYERITEMAKRHNMSCGQYVRQALFDGMKECDNAYEKGWWTGFCSGFYSGVCNATKRLALAVPCSRCNRLILLPRENEFHKRAVRYLMDLGLHHKDCSDPGSIWIGDAEFDSEVGAFVSAARIEDNNIFDCELEGCDSEVEGC